jgi:type I restriction enzyme M protein
VRGSVDGWDFKQYILGTLFYRFISENFASYIEGGDESIHYSDLTDEVIIDDIKDDAGALLHTGHGVIPVLRRLIGVN